MTVSKPDTFAFVPQRPGSPRTDDRRFINTHLSRLAAERRKRGRLPARKKPSLKASPPLPSTPAPKVRIPRSSAETAPAIATVQVQHSVPPHTSKTILDRRQLAASEPVSQQDDANDRRRRSDLDHEANGRPLTPTTLLDRGSPDPFDSTLIAITPDVHKLLSFDHEMFYPFAIAIEKGANKHSAFGNKFIYTSVDALGDQCIGYATLARLANSAATVTPDRRLTFAALDYKARAYKSLRASVSKSEGHPSEHMLTQIFSLLSMEISGQQHEHAALHARALQQVIQGSKDSGVNADAMSKKLLNSVLWHECLRGSFTLGRPVFNIEELVDHTSFLRTFLSAKAKLTALGIMPPEHVDGFQEAGIGSHLLLRLREYSFLTQMCLALQQFPDMIDDDFMTAFSFRATLTSSKLLDVFNDAQDRIKSRDGLKADQELALAHTEMATALAARYWYRVATSHEAVDVPASPQTQMYKIFGTQKPVLKHLKAAFEYSTMAGSVSQQPRLWLWILYVGTLAERADLHPRCAPEEFRAGYFHTAFFGQARELDIGGWDRLVDVLNTFLYSPKVGPLSRPLFERAMCL